MRLSHRILAIAVAVLTITAGLVFATQSGASLNVPTAATSSSPTVSAAGDMDLAWAQIQADQEAARQAAIDQLNAEQAQALADQLQAAAQKAAQTHQDAPQAAPAPVVAPDPGPDPCFAPNHTLSWIAWCESGCSPTSHNPYSTAAGKYQWLTSSWGGYGGYPTADAAPESVQDQKSLEAFLASGTSPWAASQGCWGPHV